MRGGDEFAIFCIDIDQSESELLIARLCEALKDAPLSMSFGAATYPIDGSDEHTLLEKADDRLYLAKLNTPSHKEDIEICEYVRCRPNHAHKIYQISMVVKITWLFQFP
ncbi:MAG: diguanylate cyclase [Anaerolineae bacterium]|nr:diguanylate cyclase [Anaerolineae bacterium]